MAGNILPAGKFTIFYNHFQNSDGRAQEFYHFPSFKRAESPYGWRPVSF